MILEPMIVQKITWETKNRFSILNTVYMEIYLPV